MLVRLGQVSLKRLCKNSDISSDAHADPSLRDIGVDVGDGLGEGLRGFLRQIVPDATVDDPVRIFAREFLGIGARVRVWCAVGVTFEGDCRHGDDWTCGQLLFQIVDKPPQYREFFRYDKVAHYTADR